MQGSTAKLINKYCALRKRTKGQTRHFKREYSKLPHTARAHVRQDLDRIIASENIATDNA